MSKRLKAFKQRQLASNMGEEEKGSALLSTMYYKPKRLAMESGNLAKIYVIELAALR
jgi:hypothetical protein